MGTSKVTDYMIEYIDKRQILAEQIEEELGILADKLRLGYEEPLWAEEFLELCVWLGIRPEEVAAKICENKKNENMPKG